MECPLCHGNRGCPTCSGEGRLEFAGEDVPCYECNARAKCWLCSGRGRVDPRTHEAFLTYERCVALLRRRSALLDESVRRTAGRRMLQARRALRDGESGRTLALCARIERDLNA